MIPTLELKVLTRMLDLESAAVLAGEAASVPRQILALVERSLGTGRRGTIEQPYLQSVLLARLRPGSEPIDEVWRKTVIMRASRRLPRPPVWDRSPLFHAAVYAEGAVEAGAVLPLALCWYTRDGLPWSVEMVDRLEHTLGPRLTAGDVDALAQLIAWNLYDHWCRFPDRAPSRAHLKGSPFDV